MWEVHEEKTKEIYKIEYPVKQTQKCLKNGQ